MSLKELLDKHHFRFKKGLGQNFITDPGILKKIVSIGNISKEDVVVEIGPGAGTLTKALAEKAGQVITIEIDKQLIPILNESLEGFTNITVIEGDALKIDIDQVVRENGGLFKRYKVVANLPYYITTPLIMHFLESQFNIEQIVVMVQKEVAQRLNAQPGTKEYGAITVSINFYAEAKNIFTVPRQVFIPQPDVDSAVVSLKIRTEQPYHTEDIHILRRVIRAAFNQRRKTLLNSLKTLGIEKELLAKILEECKIDPKRRGETLNLEEYVKLSNKIAQL